jgi:hypothetical protein
MGVDNNYPKSGTKIEFFRSEKLAVPEKKCEPTYHRYYSLDPIGDESTGSVLVISVCSNCSDVKEYRTNVRQQVADGNA